MSNPDWIARGIGAGGLGVSALALGFNIYKEWLRGRRLQVTVGQTSMNSVNYAIVDAHNAGNTPVSVESWGYRVKKGRKRCNVYPLDTGPIGPEQLPATLAGSEHLEQLAYPVGDLITDAKLHLKRDSGKLKIRGFVTRSGGKRILSKRRATLSLDI